MHRSAIVCAIGAILVLGSASPAAAQSTVCPIVNSAVVSTALGVSVQSDVNPDQPRGMDQCFFTTPDETDFGVSRLAGAFAPGDPGGPAALAKKFLPGLTDATRAQLDVLSQTGTSVILPGHQLTVLDGIGDYAVSARNEVSPGYIRDGLLVQRGSDAYVFEVDDDAPNAINQLKTVALAVLSQ